MKTPTAVGVRPQSVKAAASGAMAVVDGLAKVLLHTGQHDVSGLLFKPVKTADHHFCTEDVSVGLMP